jgi:tRNA nucleotidyltransferase (CCA-adding enzyme)
MIGFEGRKTPFRRGERVEVNLKGVWYRGTIGIADIDIDVYVVDRDHTPGDEMVSGAQIRRVVYAPPQ